jgi:hypothetical protein
MSAEDLPEDLAAWPDSPYEVLGVAPGVAERALKLAYTARIRRFKPERFPEHFKRLREAYERVRLWIAYSNPAEEVEVEVEPVESNGFADAAAQPLRIYREQAEPDESPDGSTPSGVRSLAVDAWKAACDGRLSEAYESLVALEDREPRNPDVIVRLYWLLAVDPQLDRELKPADWLTEGINPLAPDPKLLRLYCSCIEEDPAEVLTPRFRQLFARLEEPRILFQLAQHRWQSLVRIGRKERTEWILADVEAIRPRLDVGDHVWWTQLRVEAAGFVGWTPGTNERGWQWIVGLAVEMDAVSVGRPQISFQVDRFDRLLALIREWRRMFAQRRTGMRALLEAVPTLWALPFALRRTPLLFALRPFAFDPELSLKELSELDEAPLVSDFLAECLGELEADVRPERPEARPDLASRAGALLQRAAQRGYGSARLDVLQFCIDNAVSPSAFAEAVLTIGAHGPSWKSWSTQIEGDGPLHNAYRVWELFWAYTLQPSYVEVEA